MSASQTAATAAEHAPRKPCTIEVLATALETVAPVAILVAVGWLCAVTKVLKEEVGDGLVAFVTTIAVPVLLARTVAGGPPLEATVLRLYASYFAGVAVVWSIAAFTVGHLWGRGARTGMIAGVGAGFSNIVLMGIPTIGLAYGQAGLDVLFLLLAVHLPIMVTAATIHMEWAVRADGVEDAAFSWSATARRIGASLGKNPFIIGIAFGLAWRATGLPFTGLADRVAGLLGNAAGPVALFAVGMSLAKYRVRGEIGPAVLIAGLSLFLLPATVWSVAQALAMPPLWTQVAVLAASMPTGVNAYLFASYFGVAKETAAGAIVVATAGALVTAPVWLLMLS